MIIASCDVINPKEPVPAYVQLHNPTVTTATGADLSEKITNTWVYANGKALGVYNRTGTFPVLGTGATTIICAAGIMDNGISTTRTIYPFYKPDTTQANLQPNQTITIQPHYRYIADTLVRFDEDFESGSAFQNIDSTHALMSRITGSNVFQGSFSGLVTLTDSANVYSGSTISSFYLPADGTPIYMELDYKTDVQFQVGLWQVINNDYLTDPRVYNWVITPKSDWNKIYLNLRDAVIGSGGGNYKLLFYANNQAGDVLLNPAHIYLDNVKLLRF